MKNTKRVFTIVATVFIVIVVIIVVVLNMQSKKQHFENAREKITQGFITPADSIQTAVYWYWISDNISEEGVIKDLQAMKRVGINRAFIGNIGLDDVPYGKVKMLSEEWWEILHTALKTATELDIEIGIFNSPGWSQSGGPWVEAENAMRYLTASEIKVNGPVILNHKLEKPIDTFQDVRVVAYPVPENEENILNEQNCTVSSLPKSKSLTNIIDGEKNTKIRFPEGGQYTIDFNTHIAFTARSLTIYTIEEPICKKVTIQAKTDDGHFNTIKEFELNRVNPALNVGFVPFAPVSVSFPATTSNNFRLIFESVKPSGWPFPDINIDEGLVDVEFSTVPRVEYYAEKTLAKMHQTPLPYWKEYQWPKQAEVKDEKLVINPSKVVDISKHMMVDGTLNWEVPEGEWVIIRLGMTPTGTTNSPASPEATGYEVDKMSKEHVEKHFYGHIGEILERIPEEDRKTLKVVVQDSYETGGQNFTDGFLNEFEEVYGYDPLPYLPVYQGVVVGGQSESDRFLWDVRRLVANKVAYDYVAGLRDVSHQHGLTTWLENYGHWGFPGEFLMYGGQSDEIGGEFWSEGTLGDIENRAASSCGHIYNKNRIWAESFTCGGAAFSRYPATIKQRGDRFFAEGINSTMLHVYIHQPYEDKNPGINAGFGNPFNRKNTWFSQLDVFIQYLKRTNYMLQQGSNVADVCYFIGEDTPKMTGVTDPPLPVGYQFDYMNAEVIERDMSVEDGLITLPHGTKYKIMVLPKLETMRPELLAKIKELVNDGAIILGPAPSRSPSLQNQPEADQQVQTMAAELWGNVDGVNVKSRKYGNGMVLNGMDMKEALAFVNCVPDCKVPEDNSIHYGHRTLVNGEIYFLSNQTGEEQLITPEFRVTGFQPELWDATTGSIRELKDYEQKEHVTAIPLKLAPSQSVFVVFIKPSDHSGTSDFESNYPEPVVISELKGPWIVNFDAAKRGPEKPVVFHDLIDWTTSDDESIKHYSGTAFYTNTFNIDSLSDDERIEIDLGDLTAMAKVNVNGKYVGGVWTAPYRLDITNFAREGKNSLKIEIVNTWVNRIIGDLKLPEDERETWAPHIPYNKESPLQSSGLLGPVKVSTVNY
ncbi:MAG TPA: glycosyl hydrolase [Bacteroidales bacterium]|nr:glycosyl hydrolase [Bacteroidales bacterium]